MAEIKKDKEQGKSPEERESNIYANRQTEIKINQEYFEKMGISLDDDVEEATNAEIDISIDLDADYFKWKEDNEANSSEKKEKQDRFSGMFKGFGSKK